MINQPPEGWKVVHKPTPPIRPPLEALYDVGTVIEHEETGRQWKLLDSQRDGKYWSELAPDDRVR